MKAKKTFYLKAFCLYFVSLYTTENSEPYIITDGLFKDQTVHIKHEVELTKNLVIQENQIFDILLKRIADLDKNQKIHCVNLLEQNYEENNKSVLFDILPFTIKQGTICVCLIQNEEKYIDRRFLKKKD